jgi:hypothetical protein
MIEISWIHLVILILASFRLTHLIVYDNVTWFLRKPFLTISNITDENGRMIQRIEIKGKGVRYWIGSLLVCHWCVGIWSSLFIVVLYNFLPPVTFFLILSLAVAGIASIIEIQLTKK